MCLHREDAERIYDSGKEFTVDKLIALDTEVDELKFKIAKLSKNSSNSSKTPSSDIVKPPKKPKGKGGKKNKIGGQPGHPRNERPLFSKEEIDHENDYHLDECPKCSSADIEFLPEFEARVLQQIELKSKPFEIFEHRSYAYWCKGCEEVHYAPFPPEVAREGSHALKASYQQLLDYLPSAKVVNVDETGPPVTKKIRKNIGSGSSGLTCLLCLKLKNHAAQMF